MMEPTFFNSLVVAFSTAYIITSICMFLWYAVRVIEKGGSFKWWNSVDKTRLLIVGSVVYLPVFVIVMILGIFLPFFIVTK